MDSIIASLAKPTVEETFLDEAVDTIVSGLTNPSADDKIDLEILGKNEDEITEFVEDGQRAYKLGYTLMECPDYTNPRYKRAWQIGFATALHGFSVPFAVKLFLKNENKWWKL